MGKIYAKAINPKQYDSLDTDWSSETFNSPYRRYYYEYLKKYKKTWKNADVLEIGCGTGWLLGMIKKEGATHVEGIEPSKKNVKIIKKYFKKIKIHPIKFEEFKSKQKFDLILGVMVFNHIKNLDKSFSKLSYLLKDKGELQIIVPDYRYGKIPKFNYTLKFEKISEEEYAVEVDRKKRAIADIIRKIAVYTKSAHKSGLTCVQDVSLYPTSDLIRSFPKYAPFRKICREHLLRFKKDES